jgi:hypothetical protein
MNADINYIALLTKKNTGFSLYYLHRNIQCRSKQMPENKNHNKIIILERKSYIS